jgi:integrase
MPRHRSFRKQLPLDQLLGERAKRLHEQAQATEPGAERDTHRATVRQKKTGRPVRFELSDQTRQAVDDYLKAANKRPGEFLFTGRRGPNRNMATRQYARLVSEWIGSVGRDPTLFGTHSLRRTKATLIYRRTGNLRRSSFCSDIQRSKARSDISASK